MALDAFLTFCEDMIPVAYGQNLQDLFCLWQSGQKTDGYFVEFGALNGINVSNSYLLERLGWQGIVAEPHPDYHVMLQANRACHVSTKCVWTQTGAEVAFKAVRGRPALSTIAEVVYDDIQQQRGMRDQYVTHHVPTTTLQDLLAEYDAPQRIDCLSIDTEGSELAILGSFDFGRYRFGCIVVEHGFSSQREPIHTMLSDQGYVRLWPDLSDHDDWYVHASAMENVPAAPGRPLALVQAAQQLPVTPQSGERYRRLARFAMNRGQVDLGLRCAERALQDLGPDHAMACAEHARALAMAGQLRAAIAQYQASIALNPNSPPVQAQLDRLITAQSA